MDEDEAPADRASQRWVGAQAAAMSAVRKTSHSPDACDRSTLSGIPGH